MVNNFSLTLLGHSIELKMTLEMCLGTEKIIKINSRVFFLLVEDRAPHFHFSVGSTNYIGGPDSSVTVIVVVVSVKLTFIK